MSRALDYDIRGRSRRVGLGQTVVADILRDQPAEVVAGADTTATPAAAPAAEGFLGLPILAWVALGAGLLFLTGGRRR